jgi:nucleoside-diphosphate-sugar epimerase
MIDWKGKKVLVTGGTGFIGSVLVEKLLSLGAELRIPIRAANYRALSKLRSQIEWVEGDLRSAEYCRQIVSGVNHVFHLASHRRNVEFHHTHAADVLAGNVDMSLALISAMKESPHAGVTFFSSANVPPEIDVVKLAQQETTDGYVLGKAIAETLWLTAAKQYGFPLLVVRPVGVYGERDTFNEEGNVIPSLMIKAEKDPELVVWGSGKQERVFLYAQDLVDAVFTLLDHDARNIQYVLPPELTTVGKLAIAIRDLVKPGLPIVYDTSKPEGGRSLAMLPPHPCLKNFQWTPLEEGLKRTYEGWKAKGKA